MPEDRHPAYLRAIRWVLGRNVVHRTTQYLNYFTEQSHRAIKQRYHPMRGFGNFASASSSCTAFDELNDYLKVRRRGEQRPSLSDQRRLFADRWQALIVDLGVA